MFDQKCYNSSCLSSTIEIAKSTFSPLLKKPQKRTPFDDDAEHNFGKMLKTHHQKSIYVKIITHHAVDSSNNFSFSNEELPLTIAKTSSKPSSLSASCC